MGQRQGQCVVTQEPAWKQRRTPYEGGWSRELTKAFILFGGRRGKSKGLERR